MSDQSQAIDSVVPGILAKLAQVRRDVGAIGKTRQMNMGGGRGYAYRGIEDLYEALWPALDKNNVIAVTSIAPNTQQWDSVQVATRDGGTKTNTRAKAVIMVTLIDVDTNTSITGSALAEGVDDSDKAAGKATTYGEKNFWFHLLQIPTEDPDASRPDTTDYTGAPAQEPVKRGPGRPKQPAKPPTEFVTKEQFQAETSAVREPEKIVSTFEIATNLGELKAAWDKIPPEYRTAEVQAAKDKRKSELST